MPVTQGVLKPLSPESVSLYHSQHLIETGELVWESTESVDVNSYLEWKAIVQQSDGVIPTPWVHASQKTSPQVFSFERESGLHRYYDEYIFGLNIGSDDCIDVAIDTDASATIDSNSLNRVQVQALANLGQGKVDLGIALAESRKTATTVVKLAGEALGLVLAIKRGDVVELKKRLGLKIKVNDMPQHLAERWLEYQYGVKPLVNDVLGAIDAHNLGIDSATSVHGVATVQARSKVDRNYTPEYQDSIYIRQTEGEVKSQYRCKLRATVKAADLREQQLLGMSSPWAAGYELIPFSFMVDWFLPIGRLIQAFNAPVGLEWHSGYTSIKSSLTAQRQFKSNTMQWEDAFWQSFSSRVFERQTLTSWPAVVPYTKNPFSTTHAYNFAAILKVLTNR